MQTFKDADGNKWTLVIDLAAAKRLRDGGMDLVDDESRAAIIDDPLALLDVAHNLLKSQADDRSLDSDAFAAMLTRCFVEFMEAFVAELVFFCQSLGKNAQAAILEAVIKAEKRVEETASRKLAEAKIDNLIETELAKAEEKVDQELAKFQMSGDSSTKSPGPSESTPDP